jgi:hypothetical protein
LQQLYLQFTTLQPIQIKKLKKRFFTYKFSPKTRIQSNFNKLQKITLKIIIKKPETTSFSNIDIFSQLLSTLPQKYRIIIEYIQLSKISEESLKKNLNKLLQQEEDLTNIKQKESAY